MRLLNYIFNLSILGLSLCKTTHCQSSQNWLSESKELINTFRLFESSQIDICDNNIFAKKDNTDRTDEKDAVFREEMLMIKLDIDKLKRLGDMEFKRPFTTSKMVIQHPENKRVEFSFVRDNLIKLYIPFLYCHKKMYLRIFPWGTGFNKFSILYLPRKCRNCYSEPNYRDGGRYLIAKHGENRTNCGGRWCKCYDGKLTCNQNTCYKRREYSMLNKDSKGYDERQILVDGFWWVHDNCESNGNCGEFGASGDSWTFNSAIQHHLTYSGHAHGNSKFLPWHRKYLLDIEKRLMQFHACLTLPYWDWTMDSGDEENAHVWDEMYLGLPNNTHLGQFSSGWTLPPGFGVFGRGGSSSLTMGDEIAINNILTINDFTTFRIALEGSVHGIPHVYIGGQMGSFRSPADPFFWMHHAMIDKIWYEWQYQNGGANINSYDSLLSASISPQWLEMVSDVMDSKNDLGICYQNPSKFPWWDIIKELDSSHLLKISRSVPDFLVFNSKRFLQEVQLNKCNSNCKIKLPDILLEFLENNGISEDLANKIWCYLYRNHGNIREKGRHFYEDQIIVDWIKNKESGNSCHNTPAPTPFATKSPTINICEKYDRKISKCNKLKECKYNRKQKKCINS